MIQSFHYMVVKKKIADRPWLQKSLFVIINNLYNLTLNQINIMIDEINAKDEKIIELQQKLKQLSKYDNNNNTNNNECKENIM